MMRRPWLVLVVLGLVGAVAASPAVAVIGGSPAPAGWTFAAALIRGGSGTIQSRQFCGGALVAPSWVVTGAHCVELLEDPGALVVVGRADLASTAGEEHAVKSVHRNPAWNQQARVDDIALVELDKPSTLAPITTMAPAAEPAWDGSPKGTIVGWGATVTVNGGPSRYLLGAAVPVFPDGTCQGFLGPQFVSSKLLCGGDTTASACNGDSGGPLVATDTKGRTVVAGVSSFGPRVCGGSPSFYTRLSGYAAWIKGVTGVDPTTPATTTTTTVKKPTTTTTVKKSPPTTVKKKPVPPKKTTPKR